MGSLPLGRRLLLVRRRRRLRRRSALCSGAGAAAGGRPLAPPGPAAVAAAAARRATLPAHPRTAQVAVERSGRRRARGRGWGAGAGAPRERDPAPAGRAAWPRPPRAHPADPSAAPCALGAAVGRRRPLARIQPGCSPGRPTRIRGRSGGPQEHNRASEGRRAHPVPLPGPHGGPPGASGCPGEHRLLPAFRCPGRPVSPLLLGVLGFAGPPWLAA